MFAPMQLSLPHICRWIHCAAGDCDGYVVQLLGDKGHVVMLIW